MSSLDKALQILACYSAERVVLGVSEVAEELAMPKSSASRLMKAMSEAGLLEPSETRRGYSPGVMAFRLGNLYQKRNRVLELVDRAVADLVAEFGLTGYTGILEGNDVLLIGVRQGSFPVRLVLPKGTRVPAHVTAIGIALLAMLPDEEIRALYPSAVHYRQTDQVSSVDDVLASVRAARRDGFSAVRGATYSGFNAVGVAVESIEEGQSIGFSLSCPQEIQTSDLTARMTRRMTERAAEIGTSVGDRYWLSRTAAMTGNPDAERNPARAARRIVSGAAG